MVQAYNVYCDESCHLEHDEHSAMVLGAVWCPVEKTEEICVRIREIKSKHGMKAGFEAKWGKVSSTKLRMYLELVDYFFDDDDLHFRALIVPDKSLLCHEVYNQTHDDWYYKMYFNMLKVILNPEAQYFIYLDIKDTRGGQKVAKLDEVLRNSMYDFSRQIIKRIQIVRSHEVEILQLADLLIGITSYVNRGLTASQAKLELVSRMKRRSGYSLTRNTLYREDKVNLLAWRPSERNND